MTTIKKNNEQRIVENWDHPIKLYEDHELYKLLHVVAGENNRIDLDIEEIYDDKFLSTATRKELEKLGDFVGVTRKTAEGDRKLRKRIQAEFAAQASDTTYENFASAALSILGSTKETTSIRTPPDTVDKVVELEVNGGVLDDNPLTRSEIADLLDRTVSASAKVNLIERGTFAFAGDDEMLQGFNEGTWSELVQQ
jgi:hypothetical protein